MSAIIATVVGAVWPYLLGLGAVAVAFFAGHQRGKQAQQVKQVVREKNAALAKLDATSKVENASDAELVDQLVHGPGGK